MLELLGTGMITGLAGCSQISGISSDTTPTQQQTEMATETSSVQTPSSSEKTLVPRWYNSDIFNVEVHEEDGWGYLSVENATDQTFTKIALKGNPAYGNAIYFFDPGQAFNWEFAEEKPSLNEIVKGVYRSSYYPPKDTYKDPNDPIISGSETESGIVFEFSNLDDKSIREIDIGVVNGALGNLVSSDASKSPVVTNSTLRIPWSAVGDNCLASPLYNAKVTTVSGFEWFDLEPPVPPVSVERSVDVEDRGDYLDVRSIRFDVSFESKKPTQHLQAIATEAYESRPILDVTSSTAPAIELSGKISYPLPGEGKLPVVVMQGAPLYAEQIDLTSYI